MARRRVAGKVLAGILTPLHVRVPVALGEVIAGHSEGGKGAGDLAVAVVDSVHRVAGGAVEELGEFHGVLVIVFSVSGGGLDKFKHDFAGT